MMTALAIRYLWVMLASAVAIVVLGLGLQQGLGLRPPAIFVVLPMIIAAFDAGRASVIRAGRGMTGREGWIATGVCLTIGVAVLLLVFAGAFASQGLSLPFTWGLLRPAAFFVLIMVIMLRTTIFMGERTVLNARND